ncbi:hypothetical protein GGX14DRAFT_409300 [Mycena pura]|uniref:Uncharacterized protein n=1 Tax=Mycena pura TaxID=153505 RepID=A0AAD6URA4_9AGAR|nr:hypothetical protein GGX14DRAFT_409300 [Mycena pura]
MKRTNARNASIVDYNGLQQEREEGIREWRVLLHEKELQARIKTLKNSRRTDAKEAMKGLRAQVKAGVDARRVWRARQGVIDLQLAEPRRGEPHGVHIQVHRPATTDPESAETEQVEAVTPPVDYTDPESTEMQQVEAVPPPVDYAQFFDHLDIGPELALIIRWHAVKSQRQRAETAAPFSDLRSAAKIVEPVAAVRSAQCTGVWRPTDTNPHVGTAQRNEVDGGRLLTSRGLVVRSGLGCSFWYCVFGTSRQKDLFVNQDEARDAFRLRRRMSIIITERPFLLPPLPPLPLTRIHRSSILMTATLPQKADFIDTDEVAVSLTALQESLEPEDPAPCGFPSRLFYTEMSGVDLAASPYFRDLLSTPIEGAEHFQGFGRHQTVQEGTRKAWGTRNLASGLKKKPFLGLLNRNMFINRFLGLETILAEPLMASGGQQRPLTSKGRMARHAVPKDYEGIRIEGAIMVGRIASGGDSAILVHRCEDFQQINHNRGSEKPRAPIHACWRWILMVEKTREDAGRQKYVDADDPNLFVARIFGVHGYSPEI